MHEDWGYTVYRSGVMDLGLELIVFGKFCTGSKSYAIAFSLFQSYCLH